MADEINQDLADQQVAGGEMEADYCASPLRRISTLSWWRNTLLSSACFARHCALAAVIWTLAATVMIAGSWLATSRISNGGVVSLETLLTAAGLACSTMILSLILMGWAFGVWLIKLTAYAEAFLSLPVYGGSIDRLQMRTRQDECVSRTWKRKKYLAKFWFYISIFLLVPFFFFGNLTLLKLVSGNAAMTSKLITLPDSAQLVVSFLLAFLALTMTEVSLVALAVSAVSTKEPFVAAKKAIALSFANFAPGLLLTAAVAVVNVCIASPQVLFRLNNLDQLFSTQVSVTEMLIESAWQGLTSILLWTFLSAPLCELLRGKID